ncbi:MAG: hypothetical protein BJ554DRAFT_7230 [Olpidium bornovanus]|uniref:Uncharacterized protein n=1 Tax=Olpidium bornovanus TaxID=278681 RepID=A0A8H8DM98_9FUNG|nr:MAG: hypothetical protein BJ554DRAFT_7230 [Olpidium bornovanus]
MRKMPGGTTRACCTCIPLASRRTSTWRTRSNKRAATKKRGSCSAWSWRLIRAASMPSREGRSSCWPWAAPLLR